MTKLELYIKVGEIRALTRLADESLRKGFNEETMEYIRDIEIVLAGIVDDLGEEQ